jgi:hypothetical protein
VPKTFGLRLPELQLTDEEPPPPPPPPPLPAVGVAVGALDGDASVDPDAEGVLSSLPAAAGVSDA